MSDEISPSAWALAYAREHARPFEAASPGKVRVELLTDPWSVWCWGWEPVRRTLEARYPSVEFHALVGGMFPRLPDPRELGFDVERFFATVQRATGQPLRLDATTRDRPESTFPACVHVHAARLIAPEKERAYVRALREAAWIDALNVSRTDVAAEVAEKVGLDRYQFEEAISTGEPQREFDERMRFLLSLELQAYPTLLFTVGSRTAQVEGFQSLPSVLNIVENLSGRGLVALPPPEAIDVLAPGERVSTREVAEVRGLSFEEAYDELSELASRGEATRHRLPTGDFWSRPSSTMRP